MPGIGPRTGARILAEIGDGSAFADGSKLAAYAGLAPVTRQSGKSLNGESRSRRGNHRLKNAMFLAAFASLRDPASKTFYDRKRAEGKRTTPPSSASPAAAATSSWPCSAPNSPTSPPAPHPASPTPREPAEPPTEISRPGLTKNMGTPPGPAGQAALTSCRSRPAAARPRAWARHRPAVRLILQPGARVDPFQQQGAAVKIGIVQQHHMR